MVLEAISIVRAWPRVAADDCERLFKGGAGMRDEIGGACAPHAEPWFAGTLAQYSERRELFTVSTSGARV